MLENSTVYSIMVKKEKLIEAICRNHKQVRFSDACKVAELLGFEHKGGHTAFGKRGELKILNFQNRKGFIVPYQAKQLIEMIDKYWSKQDG